MTLTPKALVTLIVAAAMLGGYIEYSVNKRYKQTTSSIETDKTRNDITTVIKEVKTKDGTETKETTIVDKSKTTEHKEQHSEISISTPAPNWLISGGLNNNGIYLLDVKRRILGPVYIGGFVDTSRQFGVSIGLQL